MWIVEMPSGERAQCWDWFDLLALLRQGGVITP